MAGFIVGSSETEQNRNNHTSHSTLPQTTFNVPSLHLSLCLSPSFLLLCVLILLFPPHYSKLDCLIALRQYGDRDSSHGLTLDIYSMCRT